MAHRFRQGSCLVSCPANILFSPLTCLIAAALICSNATQMSTVKKSSLTTDEYQITLLMPTRADSSLVFEPEYVSLLPYPAVAGPP